VAAFGDPVVVATPPGAYAELPAGGLTGKTVIDAGNYYASRDGHIPELDSDETTSTRRRSERSRS
jgi:8-hydroxy-5-deazaflavin:NADPH oxidoreductase